MRLTPYSVRPRNHGPALPSPVVPLPAYHMSGQFSGVTMPTKFKDRIHVGRHSTTIVPEGQEPPEPPAELQVAAPSTQPAPQAPASNDYVSLSPLTTVSSQDTPQVQSSPAQPPVPAPVPSNSNEAPPKDKSKPNSTQKAQSTKPPAKPAAKTPSKPPAIPRSLSQIQDSPSWQSQFDSPPAHTEGRRLTRSSSAKTRSSEGPSLPPGPFGHIARGPPKDHATANFFRTPKPTPAPVSQSPQTATSVPAPSFCACLSPPAVNTTGSGDSDETFIGPHPDDQNAKPAADSDFSKAKHE